MENRRRRGVGRGKTSSRHALRAPKTVKRPGTGPLGCSGCPSEARAEPEARRPLRGAHIAGGGRARLGTRASGFAPLRPHRRAPHPGSIPGVREDDDPPGAESASRRREELAPVRDAGLLTSKLQSSRRVKSLPSPCRCSLYHRTAPRTSDAATALRTMGRVTSGTGTQREGSPGQQRRLGTPHARRDDDAVPPDGMGDHLAAIVRFGP